MAHDRDYFSRRAAEARAAAFRRDEGEDAEVAGQLALAYSALARRHQAAAEPAAQTPEVVES
jgi:predicted aminopeptidase